jgi:acyl-CoA thioesterase-2
MMALEPHGTDVWVGAGPRYPWGGLYGGQIVAQALRAVVSLMPDWDRHAPPEYQFFSASLDHAIWFHRAAEVDDWHEHASTSDGLISSRGVSVGHVFTADGTHLATISQEVLLRPARPR